MDQRPRNSSRVIIVDSTAAFKQLAGGALLLFLALFLLFIRFRTEEDQHDNLLLFFILCITALALLKFRQYFLSRRGFIVDYKRGTFSYAGSAVADPAWIARFCPMYWIMCLRRFTLPLNAVSKVSYFDLSRSEKLNGVRPRFNSYMLGVSGHFDPDFGGNVGGTPNVINLALLSPAPRDELYKALHAVLDDE